jgi:hypothetical protein
MIRTWIDGDRLIVAHRYGGCYDVIEVGNTGADVTGELSELPPGARELAEDDERHRARAEPVLAPNALDASAERWQLYAAKLEMTLGELRGERDRLRAALKRSVAEAELRWSGKPMSEAELDEFADHVAKGTP